MGDLARVDHAAHDAMGFLDEAVVGGRGGVSGAEAFGINWFELPPDSEGLEHDESETQQEEVNVVVRGSGVFRVDGEVDEVVWA